MKLQRYAAELIGTFSLTLAVSLSLSGDFPFATPLVAALTLGIFVYTIGSISGAHLNPAVTIALATVRKISWRDAVFYILAQVFGAELAAIIPQIILGRAVMLPGEHGVMIGIAEALGAFFLVFGVSAVVHGKVENSNSGMVIGGSLLLGIMIAMGVSNGILNPAVAIGLGSISLMYLLGPIVGGIFGAQVYKYLQSK